MRPVFCGNLDNDTRHSDLDRLFSKYGRVDRIDMKSGYAFVYFDDERDAEDAMHRLDGIPFGYSRRRLSVEWSRQVERGRERDGSRPAANTKPTRTLFVINFDPIRTRDRDLERHFEPYGTITNVRIRRNFAFIQFKTQEEATKALDNTNMSKILDRMVTVEYAFRDDDDGDHAGRDSPRRGGGGGGGYGRHEDRSYGRSDSPVYRRGRSSPDYSRARSPLYDRYDGPSYARSRSPEYGRGRSHSPPYRR